MKGIDTNVLVRFLTRDDEVQASLVYRALKEAETTKDVLFVPVLVLLETMWVLESVYEISRTAILDSIDDLLLMPVLEFEAVQAVHGLVAAARGSTFDLSDLLIAHSAKLSGCEAVITFDKKASKFELFELLE